MRLATAIVRRGEIPIRSSVCSACSVDAFEGNDDEECGPAQRRDRRVAGNLPDPRPSRHTGPIPRPRPKAATTGGCRQSAAGGTSLPWCCRSRMPSWSTKGMMPDLALERLFRALTLGGRFVVAGRGVDLGMREISSPAIRSPKRETGMAPTIAAPQRLARLIEDAVDDVDDLLARRRVGDGLCRWSARVPCEPRATTGSAERSCSRPVVGADELLAVGTDDGDVAEAGKSLGVVLEGRKGLVDGSLRVFQRVLHDVETGRRRVDELADDVGGVRRQRGDLFSPPGPTRTASAAGWRRLRRRRRRRRRPR